MYTSGMDVAISDLRAHLSHWLERAQRGEDVVVTDRGVPVARIVGLDATTALARLAEDGVIARASAPARPQVPGRRRARPRTPVSDEVSRLRG